MCTSMHLRTEEADGDVGHDGAEHGGGRLDVQPPPAVRLLVVAQVGDHRVGAAVQGHLFFQFGCGLV